MKEDRLVDIRNDADSLITSGDGPAGTTAQRLKNQARETARQATETVTDAADRVTDRGRQRAAGSLGELADTLLRSSAESHGTTQRLVGRTGEELRRLADFLETARPRDLVTRSERLARDEPLLFLGGAMVLGVIAGRFLRASRHGGEDAGMERSFDTDIDERLFNEREGAMYRNVTHGDGIDTATDDWSPPPTTGPEPHRPSA
jgi:ElaB/YqjD/DUF883 family membrane-anchored ribosome-binding protein